MLTGSTRSLLLAVALFGVAFFGKGGSAADRIPIILHVSEPSTLSLEGGIRAHLVTLSREHSNQNEAGVTYRIQDTQATTSPRSQLNGLSFSRRMLNHSVRVLLDDLFDTYSEMNSTWKVSWEGEVHNAVVTQWRLFVRYAHRGHRIYHVDGLQPRLFVIGKGGVDLHRFIGADDLSSKWIKLQNPSEYTVTHPFSPTPRAGLESRPAAGLTRPLRFWSPAPQASSQQPPAAWNPTVVVLRSQAPGQNAESVTAQLEVDSEFRDSGSYSLSIKPRRGLAETLEIPVRELSGALSALRAHQDFETIRIGDSLYRGPRPISLQTLILDLREAGCARYYFLYKHRTNHGWRPDALHVVSADAVCRIDAQLQRSEPPPLLWQRPPESPSALREGVVENVKRDFLSWRQALKSLPAELSPFQFAIFLANAPQWFSETRNLSHLRYAEALAAAERLHSEKQLPLALPALGQSDFDAIEHLHSCRTEPVSTPQVLIRHLPIPAAGRIRNGGLACEKIVRLDVPITAPETVLEVLAQSPTGFGILKALAPELNQKAMVWSMGPVNQLDTVEVRTNEPGKVEISLHPAIPLEQLLPELVRVLAQALHGLSPQSAASVDLDPSGMWQPGLADRLEMVSESFRLARKVLLDLARTNPGILPLIEPKLPSAIQLMRDWSLPVDQLARERARRSAFLCHTAIALMNQGILSE